MTGLPDENLIRAELTPAQEAKHLERRKELWKLRKSNGATCTETPKASKRGREGEGRPEEFAADTAKDTGIDKSTVNRAVSRGEKIAPDVLETIEGTDMDKGQEPRRWR